MQRTARWVGVGVVALAWTMAGHAQQPAPSAATSAPNVITLDVVVDHGKQGRPVAGLPQSSFTVSDAGSARPLTSFRELNGTREPVKVMLVLDAVNLDFERLAYERTEIEHFLKANDGQLAQPTSLALITDTDVVAGPTFTRDGNALAAALDQQEIGLRILRRSSGFYGAAERLQISLRAFHEVLDRVAPEPGRKFVVLLTPGWPLLSGPNIELSSKQQDSIYHDVIAVSNQMRQSRTTVYTVDPLGSGASPGRTFYFEEFVKGLAKRSDAYPADLGAQVFAVQSGGEFLTGSNDIAALVRQCFADAASGYELSFTPSPAEKPEDYHKLEIHVAGDHLVAHTRTGYYAQP